MAFALGDRKGAAVTPTMNVTPLVDVVLVLLIIFMVVAPLLSKQLWTNLPLDDHAPPAAADASVVLTVDAQGVFRVNQTPVPRAELVQKLARVAAARPDHTVFFDADDEAPYAAAADAIDAARKAGATVAMLTTKR